MLSSRQFLWQLKALSGPLESRGLRMSDPIVKGVKRSPSRPASRHATSSTKNRTVASKSARPKPLAKRTVAADKAPARKATKTGAASVSKTKATKKSAKSAASSARKPAKASPASKSARGKTAPRKATAPAKQPKKSVKQAKAPARPSKTTKPVAARKHSTPPQTQQRQPSRDEAAALRAFDRAHKEFARGRFSEARMLFRALLEKHGGVSEVAARARTYLNIIEARMRTESSLPRDADSLYDRGVIELNRGEYVAAQELFERALKREPEAAHIHYGLAATRARLGSIDTALESLERALGLQPNLRIRAQHDQDLVVLRNLPDFERMISAPRP